MNEFFILLSAIVGLISGIMLERNDWVLKGVRKTRKYCNGFYWYVLLEDDYIQMKEIINKEQINGNNF